MCPTEHDIDTVCPTKHEQVDTICPTKYAQVDTVCLMSYRSNMKHSTRCQMVYLFFK